MDYPSTTRFESATIILPVMNETTSLAETVEVILRDVKEKIKEILIVVCKRTTPEAMAVVDRLREDLPDLVIVHEQTLPFLGGAMREAFDLARGSHVVLMSSDLETDPVHVKELIARAEKKPESIIAASRWLRGGSFEGYSTVKWVLNWVFQKVFGLLYGTRLTDLTYAYRIYPTKLVQSIRWEELRHPFLFEALVKPLRLGVEVIEIPSNWKARKEGESQNTFLGNFAYFRPGFKTRFSSKQSILKAGSHPEGTRQGAGSREQRAESSER
jgi:glycosyltransferase involved in cell wall biosynthesis